MAAQDENANAMMVTPARPGITPAKVLQSVTAGAATGSVTATQQRRRALGNISNVLQSTGGAAQVPALARTASKAERARAERSGSRSRAHAPTATAAAAPSRVEAFADTPVERPCGLTREELGRELDAMHEHEVRRRVARMTSRHAGVAAPSARGYRTGGMDDDDACGDLQIPAECDDDLHDLVAAADEALLAAGGGNALP